MQQSAINPFLVQLGFLSGQSGSTNGQAGAKSVQGTAQTGDFLTFLLSQISAQVAQKGVDSSSVFPAAQLLSGAPVSETPSDIQSFLQDILKQLPQAGNDILATGLDFETLQLQTPETGEIVFFPLIVSDAPSPESSEGAQSIRSIFGLLLTEKEGSEVPRLLKELFSGSEDSSGIDIIVQDVLPLDPTALETSDPDLAAVLSLFSGTHPAKPSKPETAPSDDVLASRMASVLNALTVGGPAPDPVSPREGETKAKPSPLSETRPQGSLPGQAGTTSPELQTTPPTAPDEQGTNLRKPSGESKESFGKSVQTSQGGKVSAPTTGSTNSSTAAGPTVTQPSPGNAPQDALSFFPTPEGAMQNGASHEWSPENALFPQDAASLANHTTQVQMAGQTHPATRSVAVAIQKIATEKNADSFSIELDPPELGRIQIRLTFEKTRDVKAHILIERQETYTMLQKDAHILERALQNAGLETDSGSLDFQLADQGQFSGNGDESGGHGNGFSGNGSSDGEGPSDALPIETQMTWYVDPATGRQRYDLTI